MRKSYAPRGRRVDFLRGVDVPVQAGEVTALVGHSGSGKSTPMHLLGLLAEPDAGQVFVDGEDTSGLGDGRRADLRRARIGFVFQSYNLLPQHSALRNVALPYAGRAREGAARAQELLGRVGLAERAGHRPGEPSGGEQLGVPRRRWGRVAPARALVNDPKVILADEPTGNLDTESEKLLLGLFRELTDDGRAVLLVTRTAPRPGLLRLLGRRHHPAAVRHHVPPGARPARHPPVTRSVRKNLFPLRAGEVVLPAASQGSKLGGLLGKRITVDTTRFVRQGEGTGAEDHVRVVGLFDPSRQMDNPDAAFVDEATVVRWAAAGSGTPAQSCLDSQGPVGHQPAAAAHRAASVLELIRTAGTVPAILAVLAFAGALTGAGAPARQRSREIGILKAVGFRTRAVLTLLITEMALVGAVAAVAGAVLGTVFGSLGAAAPRSNGELAPYLTERVLMPGAGTTALLLLCTVLVVAAGTVLPARRAARMSPAEAIKDW
ncbi:ABC transporter ATP-binding protein/permease [Streptomyces sp. NPDC048483]|uniref:ABC transporter ATP-binding protein/permease n=1 Tax=Streptomyces sp. NPDC048483 TaxID=3154927 RepID=UPI0034459F6B